MQSATNQHPFEIRYKHHPSISNLPELQSLDPFYRHYRGSITPYTKIWTETERELLNRKHDLKYEFMQLFMIYLDIGNEDVFKILHLVSEDFDNVDSRTHLFNAFDRYFEAQGQDCHDKGTLHSVNCGELRVKCYLPR